MADYYDIFQRILTIRVIRRRRIIRDRTNPMEIYDDDDFINRFRFSKGSVLRLHDLIIDDLMFETRRNNPLSSILQILLTLRYFATGSFQAVCGDLSGLHKSTVSRTILRVSEAIARRKNLFISVPRNDQLPGIKRKFYSVGGIPGVVGAVDGTHIRISCALGDDAELFRNRKGYFSLNTQVICDCDMNIINIVCRWPGSTHDSRMFENSAIFSRFERGDIDGILLADSAYANRAFIITPLLNPVTGAERRYNRAHISTRSVIERLFGLWKRRFPCLHFGLRLKLERNMMVIIATAVLHNFAISTGEIRCALDDNFETDSDDDEIYNAHQGNRRGVAMRNTIIQNFG